MVAPQKRGTVDPAKTPLTSWIETAPHCCFPQFFLHRQSGRGPAFSGATLADASLFFYRSDVYPRMDKPPGAAPPSFLSMFPNVANRRFILGMSVHQVRLSVPHNDLQRPFSLSCPLGISAAMAVILRRKAITCSSISPCLRLGTHP